MGEEKPTQQTELPPQPIDATEHRLRILESTHEKMFSMVKWGFGTLGTLAFTLLAANLISTHSSYVRDNDILKQDVEILQKQLSSSEQDLNSANDRKMSDLKNETDSRFIAISNNLQNAIFQMTRVNVTNLQFFVMGLSNAYAQDSITLNKLLNDNINHANITVDTTLSNALSHFTELIVPIRTNVDITASRALGISLLADAHISSQGRLDLTELHYICLECQNAAIFLIHGNDYENSKSVINSLCNTYIPLLLNRSTKESLFYLESKESIQSTFTALMQQLDKANTNGQYTNAINSIKYASSLLEHKLSQ